jgi:hypothetical protein
MSIFIDTCRCFFLIFKPTLKSWPQSSDLSLLKACLHTKSYFLQENRKVSDFIRVILIAAIFCSNRQGGSCSTQCSGEMIPVSWVDLINLHFISKFQKLCIFQPWNYRQTRFFYHFLSLTLTHTLSPSLFLLKNRKKILVTWQGTELAIFCYWGWRDGQCATQYPSV